MTESTHPRDPQPYINPWNGERTSFPHAVSEYRPRTPEEYACATGRDQTND